MKGIYACDNHGGFALYNELAIKSKTDMNGFKNRTKDAVVIMGYKTYLSMNRKPLEGRINVVLYSRELSDFDTSQNDFIFIKENDWEKLLAIMVSFWNKDIFVIGGMHTFKTMEHFIVSMYQCKFLIDSHATSKFELPEYHKEVTIKNIVIDDVKITGEGNLLHRCNYIVTLFYVPKFGDRYDAMYQLLFEFIYSCKTIPDKIRTYKKIIKIIMSTFLSLKVVNDIKTETGIFIISFIQELYLILKTVLFDEEEMKIIDELTENAIKEIAFYSC